MTDNQTPARRDAMPTLIWVLFGVCVLGGLGILGAAVRAFLNGELYLKHSAVTAVDQPLFFYVMVAGVGVAGILLIRMGIVITLEYFRHKRKSS